MKRVGEYCKLLGVTKDATLSELKTIYRNQIKLTHPDKFVNDEAGRIAAEEKSKEVIEAYHFLTSINKETHEKNKAEFEIISQSGIQDFYFEKRVLYIIYTNGVKYEYLGVPQATYVKMVNADSVGRFAKRHIYDKFIYRKAANGTEA